MLLETDTKGRLWIPLIALLLLVAATGCEERPVRELRRFGGTLFIDRYRGHEVVVVYLDGTKVTDDDLVHVEGFKGLINLSLRDTHITDKGLVHLRGLKKLVELNLSSTGVTDAGMEHLKGLTKLSSLRLIGCKVTDTGLECLKGFSKLRMIELQDTGVTDSGVKMLQKALPHCVINYTTPSGDVSVGPGR